MNDERSAHERFLKSREQPILPYVIWYGPLNDIDAYFVYRGNLFAYEPLKAVEVCFQCLTALKSWPFFSDFLWTFLSKSVYGISPVKSFSNVSKFITDIRTHKDKPEKQAKKKKKTSK